MKPTNAVVVPVKLKMMFYKEEIRYQISREYRTCGVAATVFENRYCQRHQGLAKAKEGLAEYRSPSLNLN